MRTMRIHSRLFAALCAAALLLISMSIPCVAGETGVLKLKVRPCASSNWLDNAKIDVIIYRPGVGNVDSDTGYTDSSGYVEITFTDLEDADQAHVTVTPEGMSADSNHTYYWVASRAGSWDIQIQGQSLCSDGWYDEGNNIILTLYE